ncbi:MAG: hypothetical protein HQM14_07715 [SAR324 cluster bacterium]|nr:hypothetical protein [SAR324 cluster bacterium]
MSALNETVISIIDDNTIEQLWEEERFQLRYACNEINLFDVLKEGFIAGAHYMKNQTTADTRLQH